MFNVIFGTINSAHYCVVRRWSASFNKRRVAIKSSSKRNAQCMTQSINSLNKMFLYTEVRSVVVGRHDGACHSIRACVGTEIESHWWLIIIITALISHVSGKCLLRSSIGAQSLVDKLFFELKVSRHIQFRSNHLPQAGDQNRSDEQVQIGVHV